MSEDDGLSEYLEKLVLEIKQEEKEMEEAKKILEEIKKIDGGAPKSERRALWVRKKELW